MRFEFLAICKPLLDKDKFLSRITKCLLQTYNELSEEYEFLSDVEEDEITRIISITILRENRKKGVLKTITYGFQFDFDIIVEDFLDGNDPTAPNYLKSIVKRFAELLPSMNTGKKKGEWILQIFKFYDELLVEQNSKLMRSVFEIEMILRKAISLVYLTKYEDNLTNLLRDDKTREKTKKNQIPEVRYLEEFLENDFFYLNFSDYIALNQVAEFTKQDLENKIDTSKSIKSLKEELAYVPISEPDDVSFLSSIKRFLDQHTKLRNCIAHNREVETTVISEHKLAKEQLINEASGELIEFFKRFDAPTN